MWSIRFPPLEPSWGAQVPTLGAERHRRQWRHQYLCGVWAVAAGVVKEKTWQKNWKMDGWPSNIWNSWELNPIVSVKISIYMCFLIATGKISGGYIESCSYLMDDSTCWLHVAPVSHLTTRKTRPWFYWKTWNCNGGYGPQWYPSVQPSLPLGTLVASAFFGHFAGTGRILYSYPLVNIYKKLWNITMLSMGKSTLSMGHVQVRKLLT